MPKRNDFHLFAKTVLLAVLALLSRKIGNMDKKVMRGHARFLSDCKKHERSCCHLEAFKKLKTFDVIKGLMFYFHFQLLLVGL